MKKNKFILFLLSILFVLNNHVCVVETHVPVVPDYNAQFCQQIAASCRYTVSNSCYLGKAGMGLPNVIPNFVYCGCDYALTRDGFGSVYAYSTNSCHFGPGLDVYFY